MATSESPIVNLKVWFEQALHWLHADGSTSALKRSNQQLLKLMEDARNENQSNRVWEIIEELEELSLNVVESAEQGEIFLRCAKTAGDLENLKEALHLCQEASNKYQTYTHPHAISQWMIGCIHWATHQKVKAIASWQSSITLFKTQQDSLQIDTERVQWYNVIIPKLELYLELAIESGELPVFEESAPHAQSASTEKKNSPSDEVTDTIKLLAYAVNDSVPAGGFRPTGYDPDQIGYLEISEVLINHEPYKIYSTKRINPSSYTLNLTPPQEYRTVRVQGTSMNAARPIPINDGDYILVRLQGKARDNDIVVAGIFNADTLATVKRLRYHGNKIQLIPESTDPNEERNAELERDTASNEVNIVGIVEAIFKKKN